MADPFAGADRPVWVELSTSDPAAARAFYGDVFGWEMYVSPDPQYGGYAMGRIDGKDVAGIGAVQPGAPTAWSLYIGTSDADAVSDRVQAAGGTVVAPAFDVGDVGRMAVYQDPTGAFISSWQPITMPGFFNGVPNTFGWAELNARGLPRAVDFYRDVFGWSTVVRENPAGLSYTEFQLAGVGLGGAMEMNPMVPAEVPSYWMVYFSVADAKATFAKVIAAGGREMMGPTPFPGGTFAIVMDPQGAVFALHQRG